MLSVRPLSPSVRTPYLRLVVAGFRQQSAYRLAALAGLVANTTFGFLKVALLLATVLTLIGNFLADVAYVWLDPRVSFREVER